MMRYYAYADSVLFYRSDLSEEEYQILDIEVNEELNRTSTMQFVILPTNIAYYDLIPMATVIKLKSDTREIFRGRIVSFETDIYGQRTVKCESAMSYLMDSVFMPEKATAPKATTDKTAENPEDNISSVIDKIKKGEYGDVVDTVWSRLTHAMTETWTRTKSYASYTYDYFIQGGSVKGYVAHIGDKVKDLLDDYFGDDSGEGGGSGTSKPKEKAKDFFVRVLLSHNLQVEPYKRIWPGRITIDEVDTEDDYGGDSICDTYSALDGALLKRFGGYFVLRYDEEDDCYLDYLKDFDGECAQIIQLGVNMAELTYSQDTEDMFSVLLPLGKNQGTIASVNNGNIYLEVPEYIEEYGYIVLIKNFDDIDDAAALKQAGLDYISKHTDGVPVTMDVTALDMHLVDHDVDEILLGYKVNVYAPMRDIDEMKLVKKIHRTIQKPENTTYTIGDDTENDNSTSAAYRSSSGKGSSQLYVDEKGILSRGSIQFDIKDRFEVLASNIVLNATNRINNYDKTKSYKKGDYIKLPDGTVYRCNKDVDADSDFNTDDWDFTSPDTGMLYMISEFEDHRTNFLRIQAETTELYTGVAENRLALLRIQGALAGEFTTEPNKPYKKGDYIWHDGEMWIAHPRNDGDTIPKGTEFDERDWVRPSPDNGFVALNGTLYATKAYVEELIANRIEAVEADISSLTSTSAIISRLQNQTISAGYVRATTVNGTAVYSGGVLCATQEDLRVALQSYVRGPLNTTYVDDGQGHMVTVYCP